MSPLIRLRPPFSRRINYFSPLINSQDEGWKLNRTNYYQEGWLATGNVRGIVGVTFTSSHCRKNAEVPLRTNYNLRGHRSDVSNFMVSILCLQGRSWSSNRVSSCRIKHAFMYFFNILYNVKNIEYFSIHFFVVRTISFSETKVYTRVS